MLRGEAPRWQIKERQGETDQVSEQAQLDTLGPHLCVRSRTPPGPRRRWSTRRTKRCRPWSVGGSTIRRGTGLEPRQFKDISAHRHPPPRPARPPAPIHHVESIIFHGVYHPLLYVLSSSADNCFPSPSAPRLPLFIAPLLLHRPRSMNPRQARSALQLPGL